MSLCEADSPAFQSYSATVEPNFSPAIHQPTWQTEGHLQWKTESYDQISMAEDQSF